MAAATAVNRTWESFDMDPSSRTNVPGESSASCRRMAACSRSLPAGGISRPAANGEINCLDPGAYGAVTITKSLSIICEYTQAGVLATGAIIVFELLAGGLVGAACGFAGAWVMRRVGAMSLRT